MDTYKFIIKDYHSINNASIRLDGITVLAGLNGCGKSTLSRWLYGFVRYSNAFDDMVDKGFSQRINEKIKRLYDIFRRVDVWAGNDFQTRISYTTSNLEDTATFLIDYAKKLSALIESNWGKAELRIHEDWLWRALDIDNEKDLNLSDRLNLFLDNIQKFVSDILNEAIKVKANSSKKTLFNFIENGLMFEGAAPDKIEFIENGTSLIENGRFMHPISLKRAIYIDSPMAISNMSQRNYNKIWDEFGVLMADNLKEMPCDSTSIALELRYTLGGNIVMKDEDLSFKQLRYVRKADGLDISIDELATGMKSFAYLLRLLENGYLDSETLLIIDEPEAHLHPQWIFKFAKILVLLNKKLGVKIMIASHNPDMVAAISAISEAEGSSANTNFYQAEKVPGTLRFDFKHCGNDISPIFECFNIAIDRIDSYKPSLDQD